MFLRVRRAETYHVNRRLAPSLLALLSLPLFFGLPACQVGDPAIDDPDPFLERGDLDPGVLSFSGGFTPNNAPYGGFGGGACSTTRTPVIFVHGNGDEAKNWDFPSATGVPSVYASFVAAGYNKCELFGIQWLSDGEREAPQYNYHRPEKAQMLADFVADVRAYTGSAQVDVIAHSLGVTVAMHALEYDDIWSDVRRFIAISGGMRGLKACLSVGYANSLAPTCGSQNFFNSDIFGFYPSSGWISNPRMGSYGFRTVPESESTLFYSLRAGLNDQILCSTAGFLPGCDDSALYDPAPNVRAQLHVGHGSTAADIDFDLSDWSWYNAGGGDIDGVGHFRAKNNTGAIQVEMLSTECTGTSCCASYAASCQ